MISRSLWVLIADDGSGYGENLADQLQSLCPFPIRTRLARDAQAAVELSTYMPQVDVVLLDCDVMGMAIGDAAGLISWIALEHRAWILAVSDKAERLWPLQGDDVFAGTFLRTQVEQLRDVLVARQEQFPVRDLHRAEDANALNH